MGGGVRGNVRDSSLASWKARSRLPIGYNCTFLLALTANTLMRRNNMIEYFSLSLIYTAEALIRLYRLLLKGWVILGLNSRLKGYVSRQYLYTIR